MNLEAAGGAGPFGPALRRCPTSSFLSQVSQAGARRACSRKQESPPDWEGSDLVLGGGGPIYALAPTDTATVPVRAVLWLNDESAT